MDHIAVVALMALFATGAHAAMLEGMIAAPLGLLLAKLPAWLHKPTHTCPPCMCLIWGTGAWFAIGAHTAFDWWVLPVHIIAAAGLAWVINKE